jgi:laminin alpha 1/2
LDFSKISPNWNCQNNFSNNVLYQANTDADCMRAFGVPATVGVPKFTRDDEVICTSYFSQLNPLEQGEIHTSLVNSRPGAEHPTAALQNFTRTR